MGMTSKLVRGRVAACLFAVLASAALAPDDGAQPQQRFEATPGGDVYFAVRSYPAGEQPPGCWWLPARYGGSAPTLEQAAALDAEEKATRAARRASR